MRPPGISVVLMVAGSGPRSTGPAMSVAILWVVVDIGVDSTGPAADAAVGSIGSTAQAARNPPLAKRTATRKSPTRLTLPLPISPPGRGHATAATRSMTTQRGTTAPDSLHRRTAAHSPSDAQTIDRM